MQAYTVQQVVPVSIPRAVLFLRPPEPCLLPGLHGQFCQGRGQVCGCSLSQSLQMS